MRKLIAGFAVVAPLLAFAPASAQQIVETSTGAEHANGQCSVSQAMLAAIETGNANRELDTKARINAFLDNALASTRASAKTKGQSPVVFPPARNGS